MSMMMMGLCATQACIADAGSMYVNLEEVILVLVLLSVDADLII